MHGTVKNAGMKRNTLQTTGDAFIQGGNRYESHLMDFDEMPRLSILNNYKRIKQIMNSNYVKGFAVEQKYRNRTKQDSDQDPEWAKYKEEKQNSQKMSTILRSLNAKNKKKRTVVPSDSMTSSQIRANARSSGMPIRGKSTPYGGIKPLVEAEENDEMSNR